jgi:hypothetical protein
MNSYPRQRTYITIFSDCSLLSTLRLTIGIVHGVGWSLPFQPRDHASSNTSERWRQVPAQRPPSAAARRPLKAQQVSKLQSINLALRRYTACSCQLIERLVNPFRPCREFPTPIFSVSCLIPSPNFATNPSAWATTSRILSNTIEDVDGL